MNVGNNAKLFAKGLLITTNFYNNMIPDKMLGEWIDAPGGFKLIQSPQAGACGITHTSKEGRDFTIICKIL